MSGRITTVGDALDLLVPPFEPDTGNWDEIAGRVTATPQPHRWTRRRALITVVVAAVAATLIATPAFGIRGLILDLIGRTNVPFTGATAPVEIKRNFFDLGLGLPPGEAPEAIASQTRRVASFRSGGVTHVLWVAPTRQGGFCWTFTPGLTGCVENRTGRTTTRGVPMSFPPATLGLSFGEPYKSPVQHVTQVSGDVLAPTAYSVTVKYADGTQTPVPFYFVSKPIDAGFFLADISAGHDTTKTRATAVEVRDKNGRLLASHSFGYQTPAQRAKDLARAKAEQQAFLRARKKHPAPAQPHPPSLPAPTAPLQRGEAGGVTVTAGHNGIVVFDTSGATPAVRALIAGLGNYGCFGPLPYHTGPVDLVRGAQTLPSVAIRVNALHRPYLGCDVGGSYGHRWPDRLHGHSAVEIAFTPAGTRYFANRAAARDLALFVRSNAIHRIRKLTGSAVDQAIRARYSSQITKLSSANAKLAAGRIGYATSGNTTTFVEWSTIGHRFYVRIVNGKIATENVEPLGFVF